MSGTGHEQVITKVEISNTEFLTASRIPLNPGLVGIIGARGSKKTALADFIALSAEAFQLNSNRLSFIDRAREHLKGVRADLGWGDDTGSGAGVDGLDEIGKEPELYVRYLSQQFVDRLCSAEGLTDELLKEIQRVIFLAHPTEDRLGATAFDELLELKAEPARTARLRRKPSFANCPRRWWRNRRRRRASRRFAVSWTIRRRR